MILNGNLNMKIVENALIFTNIYLFSINFQCAVENKHSEKCYTL